MEDTFGEHPLPASRTAMAKGIITVVLLVNSFICWSIKEGPSAWAPPSAYGLVPLAVFLLALGWLHAHPGMAGAKPASVLAWILGLVVLVGGTLTVFLSWSSGGGASDKGIAIVFLYGVSLTQLVIPIAVRWARNADESFLQAGVKVTSIIMIISAMGLALILFG